VFLAGGRRVKNKGERKRNENKNKIKKRKKSEKRESGARMCPCLLASWRAQSARDKRDRISWKSSS
jgi:hypothetical protein